jgi:tRNA A-37 threonylcarbamoyl transferase component Bud32
LVASAKLFQSNQYQQLFAQHQLADFGAIWVRDIAWFEPPNERRGGWSGVGTIELQDGALQDTALQDDALQSSIHAPLRLFVKKQQNHGRKSWRHPFAGEPTFRREFNNLKFLAKHNIGAPKLVYYAENMAAKQAILITEELIDFVPLDTVQLSSLNQAQQHTLIQTVATEVKRFHNAGLVHRALYPKHIFVKNAQTAAEIAFIDLEKARHSNFACYRAYFDLAAFLRHSDWSADNKQLFINTYLAKQDVNFFDKLLCNMINRRANRG